jgi:hypothetical protein
VYKAQGPDLKIRKKLKIGNAAMSNDDFNNDTVFKVALVIGAIVVVSGLGGLLTLL